MPILKIKDNNNNWVGVPVAKGDTGENAYVWIKYSATQPTADSDMTDTPSPWIGLYSGTSDSAPSHYTDYTWYKVKGEQGEQGEPGETGATPDFSIGTVTTGVAGSSASASITGTAEHPVLNLTIPRGNTGEVSEAQLFALLPTDTASGAVASFPDGADDVPMVSLSVALEPIQSLNGYDNPWPAGGGKNLVPLPSTENGWVDGFIGGTGSINAGTRDEMTSDYIPADANTTYAVSVSYTETPPESAWIGYGAYDSNKNFIGRYANSVQAYVATTPANTAYIRVTLRTFNLVNTLQLEKGSSATSYAPYENICPISGWTEANVHRTGTNVWDEEWEVGGINTSTGADAGSTDRIRSKNYISVVGGEDYYFNTGNVSNTTNMVLLEYDKDKVYTGTFSYRNKNQPTRTFGNDTAFVRFYMVSAYGTTYNHDISINYPSTDHDYHAYTGNTYTIDLDGTRYGGSLDVTTGVLTVDRALYTFTGNEHFAVTVASQGGNFNYFRWYSSAFTNVISNWNLNNEAIMSGYKVKNQLTYWYSGGVGEDNVAWTVKGNAGLCVRADQYADETSFKNSIAGQTLCYLLATPLVIQLTATEISTLLGNNTVWSDSGDVAVTYKANIQKYIDKKIAEL